MPAPPVPRASVRNSASLTFAVGNVAPVPEPEIAMLTLAGLIAVFARRRRSAAA